MKKLICMTFDGDYVTEGEFETIDAAWDRANDMGSRWLFYPFTFVTSDSGNTIIDAPEPLYSLVGKRVKSVVSLFAKTACHPDLQNADSEVFADYIASISC